VARLYGIRDKFTPEQWKDVERKIAELNATPRIDPALTRFEDPKTYRMMTEFRAMIMDRAEKVGCPIDFPPFLATLPSGDVNARIVQVPGSKQPVLFFEQGLVQFLIDFAALVSWVMPVLPMENLNDWVLGAIPTPRTIPADGLRFFTASLRSYVVDGNPAAGSLMVPPRPENDFLHMVLFKQMMKFVFLHEFHHLDLGHLQLKDTSTAASYGCEFEADIAAARFLAGTLGNGWALSFWACDLVLIAFNLLDQALGVYAFGDYNTQWISETHPSATSRREFLLARVGAGVANGSLAAGRHLYQMNETLFDRLWEMIVPEFAKEHMSGVRPSPMWSEKIEGSLAPIRPMANV